MIVWVASFPRSGNTFLRIVLHRHFGIETSVDYDLDGVAARIGGGLIGFRDRPSSRDEMRRSGEVHFIKTHRQRGDRVHESDKAICLVRDGRDTLVSWARLHSESEPRSFETHLEEMISTSAKQETGAWGRNVLSWMQPPAENRVVLRYTDLIASPTAAATKVVQSLGLDLRPRQEAVIPAFPELNRLDHGFFRRGISGSYRDEMPEALHDLFWSKPENIAAMALIGCPIESCLADRRVGQPIC